MAPNYIQLFELVAQKGLIATLISWLKCSSYKITMAETNVGKPAYFLVQKLTGYPGKFIML